MRGHFMSPDLLPFADELSQVFTELSLGTGLSAFAGECSPPVDAYETDDAVHVVVDLPGVEPASVRVIVKGDGVLVAGVKSPRRGPGGSSFHLVERGFGRFARHVRLGAPCNPTEARAALANGELHVTLPKVAERRGRPVRIAVDSTGTAKPS